MRIPVRTTFSLALVATILLTIVTSYASVDRRLTRARVIHTYKVLEQVGRMERALSNSERIEEEHAHSPLGLPAAVFESATSDLEGEIAAFAAITSENSRQQAAAQDLKSLLAAYRKVGGELFIVQGAKTQNLRKNAVSSDAHDAILESFERRLEAASGEEKRLLDVRAQNMERTALTSDSLTLLLGFWLLGTLGLTIREYRVKERLKQRYEADMETKMAEIEAVNAEMELQQLELEQYSRHLERLATTDGLTGVANHRFFQERLGEEVNKRRTGQSPLGLILLDVDRFKSFNDLHGHQTGDRVLQVVAETVGMTMGVEGVVARYGGEEFAIILPGLDAETSVLIAEALRQAIEELEWPHEPVTASFGVADWHPGLSSEDLIGQADQALYESKANGRNRVTPANPISIAA